MSLLHRVLPPTVAVLAVGVLGPACGQTTDGATDAVGGSMATGAASSDGAGGSGGQRPSGSGASPGSGGGSPGECFFQPGDVQPCPDFCSALLQATCDEASSYELSSIERLCPNGVQRVSWSDEDGGLHCYYQNGNWIGTYQYAHTPAFCGGTSTEIRFGDNSAACPAPDFETCAGSGAAAESGGGGKGGAPVEVPRASCYSDFFGTCGPCCQSPPPDCSDKPDGYPGYSCFSGFCSCNCFNSEWSCAC